MSDLIPPQPYGRGAELSLALALSVEIANGETSPWHAYLQSLPRELPWLFWAGGVDSFSLEWLNGTEASRPLVNLVKEMDEYYNDIALPLYSKLRIPTPTLRDFRHACGLVSSRAFLVDAYHGLSMVPIADAFNHIQDNHVHLESDFDVCPECGSLNRCLHDDDYNVDEDVDPPDSHDGNDDVYEMVSNRPIPANSEIFNTYGETLTNAQLLIQYGFILDVNDNDCLTWTSSELGPYMGNDLSPRVESLLSSLTSLPWECMSESEMVHVDRVHQFSVNGDASVSHSLWLYFALHLILATHNLDSATALGPILENLFHSQLAFERSIGEGATLHLDDDISPYGVIPKLAGLLASLCRARTQSLTGKEKSTEELGDLLDTLADANPHRMAISLVLTERSLLDSCMAAWEALALVRLPEPSPLESS
ncbi:SET domain-containing protein [Mycena amicta]|nr:SET domain-containing protein [Mycena amicta]